MQSPSAAPPVPPLPVTMDYCATVAQERMEPDGTPLLQFPWTRSAEAQLDPGSSTPDCSFSTLRSSCQVLDKDIGLQQVSDGFMGSAAASACSAREQQQPCRQPVICRVHAQGLGRDQEAGYWAYCTNQAAEDNSRRLKEQHKAEAVSPPPPLLSSCPFLN